MQTKKKVVSLTSARIANLADEYGRLKEEKARIEAEIADLRQRILETDLSKLVGGEFVVSVAETKSRRFDTTRFKKDHPRLYEKYVREGSVTVVNVKKKD